MKFGGIKAMEIGITEIVFGIILAVLAAILIVCVLMQSGKDKKLSGTIAGGAADSFYAKGKGKSKDKILARITTILAVVFVIVAVAGVVVVNIAHL